MKGQAQLFSKDSDEWRTPRDLFDRINAEQKFVLDVAATHENALCKRYFTKEDNGIIQKWSHSNWCNPPYSSIKYWVEKAHEETKNDNITVMLIPARTDTKWFHEFIYPYWHINFLKGRLKFSDSKNSAPFPSMLVYFGVPA